MFGHQGDVFFQKIDDTSKFELLEEVSVSKDGGITLVEGELTGHHHQFREPEKAKVYLVKDETPGIKTFLVKIVDNTTLQHYDVNAKQLTKEHNDIPLPAGNYLVRTQRQMAANREIERALD